jgi:hypothetical protein
MYSNKIDLVEIFMGLPFDYCIIRIPEYFPNYYEHSDIDVLCRDSKALADYLQPKFRHTRVFPIHNKWHVDVLLPNGNLDLKFDLMDNFLFYTKSGIKPEFTDYIFDNLIHKNHGISVPNIDCELALRYIEYNEYINVRPEKIKHYEYIKNNAISDNYKDLLYKFTKIELREK